MTWEVVAGDALYVAKPTNLDNWHDVQEFGDQSQAGEKFLDATTANTPSNESTILMLQSGEIKHVAISTSRNPTDVATVKIFKGASRGGSGKYAGGTQIGTDLSKVTGTLDRVYSNLTGFTFASGDRISVYLEKAPDSLYSPMVKLFIRYD
jgi:hypothetical protein